MGSSIKHVDAVVPPNYSDSVMEGYNGAGPYLLNKKNN
jgi:hypothetical protein